MARSDVVGNSCIYNGPTHLKNQTFSFPWCFRKYDIISSECYTEKPNQLHTIFLLLYMWYYKSWSYQKEQQIQSIIQVNTSSVIWITEICSYWNWHGLKISNNYIYVYLSNLKRKLFSITLCVATLCVDYYIIWISSYITKLCKSQVKTSWLKGESVLYVSC